MTSDQPAALVIDRLWGPDLTDNFVEVLNFLSEVGLKASELNEVYRRMMWAGVRTYVGKIGERIVATASYFVEPKFIHRGGKVGHIEDVVVHPAFRGQHIGRKLVAHLVKECKEAGCYKIILNCSRKNVSYYEECGFTRHAYQMRMNLDGTTPPSTILKPLEIEIDAEPGQVSLGFFEKTDGFALDIPQMTQLIATLQEKLDEANNLLIADYFNQKPDRGDITDLKAIKRRFYERAATHDHMIQYSTSLGHLKIGLIKEDVVIELQAGVQDPVKKPSERLLRLWNWIDSLPN